MQLSFRYEKSKVLQALRYHFIWQPEIRILLIVVIVFDIISAILYLIEKIRPEPFLLGSLIWIIFLISFWYIIPINIYKKSVTFQHNFIADFDNNVVTLQHDRGIMQWEWSQFTKFIESPNFFHVYFSQKSFFLFPKDNMTDEFRQELRALFHQKIGNKA